MKSKPKKDTPIKVNGNGHVAREILRIVVCSVAKAKLAALFLRTKEGNILRLTLEELRTTNNSAL